MRSIVSLTAIVLLAISLCAMQALAEVRDGSVTVDVAGTAEPLSTTLEPALWVTVQCQTDNVGHCFIGGSTIEDGRGIELAPGDSYHLQSAANLVYDLRSIYADVASSGDKVTFVYFKAN